MLGTLFIGCRKTIFLSEFDPKQTTQPLSTQRYPEIAMTTLTPDNLKYTSSHEWIREEDGGIITVGITEHAQSLLGDVVFVELPETGKNLAVGEACAVIESVKAAADVYAPVAGEVMAVNDELEAAPELVNSASYEGGWLCQIKVANPDALANLMTADAYQASIAEE